MSRNIGIPNVNPPKMRAEDCDDEFCPFHGTTRIRGKITKGVVVSKRTHNTVIIRFDYVQFIKKYQRYERRNSRLACHLPTCLEDEIEVGDMVLVGESRKISKTKAFIVLDKTKKPGEE
ncbi:MAG: 30S ribosomal protein S17 [Candidatus Lokiarchaeota archaeon]|nr:30S ribosomal protein S17 [Candidatus Lokiarchaeota archaeon]MBD3200758.1 30S ribosomal protein S17 [Candidatus Lokiarchaeota archaeon]